MNTLNIASNRCANIHIFQIPKMFEAQESDRNGIILSADVKIIDMEEKRNPVDKNQGDTRQSNFVTDGPAINNEREEKISNWRGNIIDKDEGNMHHGILGGNFNDEETNNEKSEDK